VKPWLTMRRMSQRVRLTTIESIEVDVDASEVEQVVPVKILNHKVWHHENGLWSVWVRLQFNDGFKADGHVRSTFLGDSEEGLDLFAGLHITGQGHTGVPCEKYCYLGLLLSLFGSLF